MADTHDASTSASRAGRCCPSGSTEAAYDGFGRRSPTTARTAGTELDDRGLRRVRRPLAGRLRPARDRDPASASSRLRRAGARSDLGAAARCCARAATRRRSRRRVHRPGTRRRARAALARRARSAALCSTGAATRRYLRTIKLVLVTLVANTAVKFDRPPRAAGARGPAAAHAHGPSRSYPSAHATTSFAAARALSAAACPPRRSTRVAARDGALAALPRRPLPLRHRRGRGARRRRGALLRREGRHRRAAERGQVLALQRAHPRRRPGGQLPVHDGRAERGGRAACPTSGSTGSPRRSAPRPTVHETIEFHDIAGLVRGAHRARGWATSSSRTSARPTRSCTSCARTTTPRWSTPRAASTRSRDVETIETELLYADLEQAERRLERVSREAKSGDKASDRRGGAGCAQLVDALQEGRPARTVPPPGRRAERDAEAAAAHRRSRCSTWRTWPRARRSSRRRRW